MKVARWLSVTAVACTALAFSMHPTPRFVWNATASAPIGLYVVERAEKLATGELVLASPPASLERFASRRGYLPAGVPLVKHIAALAGDEVCGKDRMVTINDKVVAIRLVTDRLHRPLPRWGGCRRLKKTDVLLMNESVPQSFDGRYFGPISTAAIIGRLEPIWTR